MTAQRKCSHPARSTGSPSSRISTPSPVLAAADRRGSRPGLGRGREQLVVLAEAEILERRALGASGTASRSITQRTPRARGDVAGVAGEPVRDVEHRVRRARELAALGEAQRRPDEALLAKRGAGGAERAGDDEQSRPGLRAAAAGNALRAAERGDREQRACRRESCRRRRPARRSRRCPRRARGRPRRGSRPARRARRRGRCGSAPEAARSLRFTAAARKPRSRHEIQSSRKCTSSTSASCVTTRPSTHGRVVLDLRRQAAPLELGEQAELAERQPVASANRRLRRGPRG